MMKEIESMKEIEGKLVSGHQVASGLAKDSPFSKGTIAMQRPYFLKAGLDLSDCYLGTLNVDIGSGFSLSSPDYLFADVKWAEDFPAESFSFFKCTLFYHDKWLDAYIYYPHPETKIGHFQNDTVIEILTVPLANIHYGDQVTIKIDGSKLTRV
ncbi:hypothetical protein [Shewanella surugensis]|uniref:Uncharacterized protein n=1 Tax=Shewanella surugensis TaxID=212020 RepID=A0ABT0LAY3_9GAMM|nr:hypothetical protein [Shewanella surugensis]MCL1124828.1 hypothetical protein [Shewanella surugensis]